MKRWLVGVGMIAVAGGAVRAADAGFSRTIRAEEFAAAGLGKLSAEELRRLDALVRDYRTATVPLAVAKERPQARAAEVAVAPAAKVKLAPGTAVEYASVESRIVGEFRGWEGRTLFTLENGQRWQVASGEMYATPPIMNPAVKIAPGILGTFWMTVEGVRTRVKVVPVGGGK